MGIDRIAMLKYGMPDLRAFFDADVRWLAHYGFRPLDLPTLAGGLSAMSARKNIDTRHRSPLDRAFFAIVTRGWDSRRIESLSGHAEAA